MAVKFKLSNEEKERANRFLEIMNEQKSNDTSNSNLFVNQNSNLPGVNNKANNYALPTVRLATNEEKNIKQKTINKSNNLLSKVGYVAKKGGTGILSGITGIAQAGLTDTANNLQKGNDKSGVEVATNLLEATSGILNPMQTYNKYIKNLPNMIGNAIKTINDKDSNTIEKITSLGTTALSDALSNNTARNILDSGVQLVGKVLPDNASEKTLELNKKISEPIDKINQNLYLEGQNYDKATQFMGDATQSVGNMVPSIAVTAITKNPNIGLLTMGISAKGQSTQEALNKGATLNEAIKIGDTKGAIEVATEMLTGGVNIFGKGALDDIVEKGIKDKVKSKVGKYLLEKGYQLGGEVLEETISDVLGTAIDKGTVDPDATYSIEDWGDTAVTTILSTLILNAITGGIGKTNNYDYNTQQRLQEAQNIIDNVNNKNNLSNLQQEQINNNSNIQIQQIMPQQNKMYQNQTSNQIQLPIRSYQYVETENTKINNLRQDMSKYWIDTNETKALGSVIEKIITDKGYNVRLDNTIKNQKGNSVNAQITTLNNGEVEIRINPNAKNVGEFLLMHETTHAIGTQEMKDLVMDYASKNTEFNNALESLKETYGVQDVSDEVLADISGQLFGNQEFINNLSMEKPNIFKKIYNKIIELANKITGNSNEVLFVRNLANKWQEAYRTQNNNLNNNSYYSIQTDTNGDRYIKVDTDQHIFDGIAEKDYNKIAKMYMQDYLMGKTTLSNNDNTIIDRKSINKYTNPGNTQYQFEEKMKLTPELRNVLKISEKVAQNLPTKSNSKYSKWEYYKFKFTIDGNSFEGLVNIGIDNNGNKHFYEINQIKKTSISGTSLNRSTSLSNNSILPTNKNVNSTTKYSMQESTNNSQWQQHLNNNYKATGTRTNLEDIKLPTKGYFENKKMQEVLTDADYEVLNKIYEKEEKTQIFTEKKKAKLLEKYANDKFAIKDSLDILAQKFINKGHYIDQLSQKANNPELKFTYDRNLNSFAEGQYVIGVAQTDNQGNNIGKSINDIWRPIEDKGLTKEFSEYLLHKHNIDRSGRNKFIFGEEIGPTESTAIALELENRHPEFKQYAKDIKEFNHNNLNNLKEAGMLTQDTIDYIEAMYPNYIAISRNIEDSLYTGNNEKTGTTSPLKKATGGNADIQPIKETMAQQSIRIKRLINQNELGKELSKTLKNSIVDEGVDISLSPTMLLDMDTMVDTDVDGSKYYLYFEDGKQLKLKINDNLYESLKATEISKIEKTLPVKALQKVNNIHRSLLTSSNPLFIVTNFFKDFQDGAFNSKYSSKFVKNYGKALNEIYTKGKYYESYMANGGMSNTYFDYETGIKKTNKFVEKIRNANEIVEQLPRLAEFISTLEDGKSLNEALYNAAEITTNFKRGGDITKAINRNGANFLNASIQGFDKQFRNFSGQNGAKGYINLLAKATIMSIMPAIFNHMLLSDDEDYQDLPQSDKDLYYLFKYDEGKFRRIPKGRVLSIFGAAARRTLEMIQGQDDAWDDFGSTIINQVAPNNPLEDNILAPIIQVKNNKTWYGTDLVSSRLQKELPENQYDERTDNFSKWLGKQIKVSPKKINYLIDQYSGGIGDIILPMITPQAKQNVFVDKFTTDSVLKNKNVSKFYETLEKQTQIANDNFATDEDELQLKYLNSISKDMSDLYKEKRQVQMSNISNKEKTQKVREIQEKINQLAEKGLINYKNGSQNKNSSKIGDEEYYKNSNGEWTILTDEEKNKNTNISTETYSDYKQKVYNKKNEKVSNGELKKSQDLKTKDKIQILLDSKYSEKEKKAIYESYIKSSNDTEYDIMQQTGINFEQYLKYKQQDFESDKKDDGTTTGKTVSGSKKTKVYDYINNMNIEYNQKLVLLGTQYTLTSSGKSKLANYINELNIKKGEKLKIYEKLKGFTVYKDGRVTW